MNFRILIPRFVAVISLICGLSQTALALELADVKVDETANVASQELKLNGAGIRTKVFFKVYVAGLYVAEKKTTASEILALAGAKRVKLSLLREVGSEQFNQSFTEGINSNSTTEEKIKIAPQLAKFNEVFGKVPTLNKGDVITLDWIPASGTLVQLNGKPIADAFPDVDL